MDSVSGFVPRRPRASSAPEMPRQREPLAKTQYVAAAVRNTSLAWTLPGAISHYFASIGPAIAACLHSGNQQRTPTVHLGRRLSLDETGTLAFAKYVLFIPALGLRAWSLQREKDGKGPLPPIRGAVEKPLKAIGQKLGGVAGRVIGNVPVVSIASLALAQNLSSAGGSLIAAAYLRHLFPEGLYAAGEADRLGHRPSAAAWVAGAAAFAPMLVAACTSRGRMIVAALPKHVQPYVMPVLVPLNCVVSDVAGKAAADSWNAPA